MMENQCVSYMAGTEILNISLMNICFKRLTRLYGRFKLVSLFLLLI